MEDQQEFEFFSGHDSPFSLQFKADFEIDGKQFISADHYITYQQAVLSNDETHAKQILSASEHEKIKEYGKGIHFDMEAWQNNRLTVLEDAIEAKFDQNPDLHESLLATHPKLLVEATPGNRTWGIGLASTDNRAWDKGTWKGENSLGYAMTRLRDKLMAQPRKHNGRAKKQVAPKKEGEAAADSENTVSKKKKKKKKKMAPKEEEGAAVTERQAEGAVGEEEATNGDVYTEGKWLNKYTGLSGKEQLFLFYSYKSPFSHHYPASFVIDGKRFNCGEQYMMYQKAVIFKDKDIEEKVMATSNPAEHKRLGRMIPSFDFEVWKECCQQVVECANWAKFSQNPDLKKKLFKTYPKLMVEASPSDFVWGIGRDWEDPLAWDMKTWRGKNQLGYILTKVRDMLMEEEAKSNKM